MVSNQCHLKNNSSSISDHSKVSFTTTKCLPSDKQLSSPSWKKRSPSSSSGTASMSSWSKTSTPIRSSSQINDFPTKLKMAIGRRPEEGLLGPELTDKNSVEYFGKTSQQSETSNPGKAKEFQSVHDVFLERSMGDHKNEVTKERAVTDSRSWATSRARLEGLRTNNVVSDSSWINRKPRKHVTRTEMGCREASPQPPTAEILEKRAEAINLNPAAAPTEIMMNLSHSHKESDDGSNNADPAKDIHKNPSCVKNNIAVGRCSYLRNKDQLNSIQNGIKYKGRLQSFAETKSSDSMKNNDGSIQSAATPVGVKTGMGDDKFLSVAMATKTLCESTPEKKMLCVQKEGDCNAGKREGLEGTEISSIRQSRVEAMLAADASREKMKNVTENHLTGVVSSTPSISTHFDSSCSGLEQEYERRGLQQSKTQIQQLYSPDRVLFSQTVQRVDEGNAHPYTQGHLRKSKSNSNKLVGRGNIRSMHYRGKHARKLSSPEEPSKTSIAEGTSRSVKKPEDIGHSAVSSSRPIQRYLSAINAIAEVKSEKPCAVKESQGSCSDKSCSNVLDIYSETKKPFNSGYDGERILSTQMSRIRSLYEQERKTVVDDDSSIDVKSICSIFEESSISSNSKTSGDMKFESLRCRFEHKKSERAKTCSLRDKFETRSRKAKFNTNFGNSSRKRSITMPSECSETSTQGNSSVSKLEEKLDVPCKGVKKMINKKLSSSGDCNAASTNVIQTEDMKISRNDATPHCEKTTREYPQNDKQISPIYKHDIALSVQDRIKSFSAQTEFAGKITKQERHQERMGEFSKESQQTPQQNLPFSAFDKKSEESERTDNDGYEDGVTLDLSISEVSVLTTPTCIRSREELSTVSRQSSDLRVLSEASSDQTSEAATPLLAMSLRSKYLNSSDDFGNFANRNFSDRLAVTNNNSKWTPLTTPINEKMGDTEKSEDLAWSFGDTAFDYLQMEKESGDENSVWQPSWGSLDESGWQSFETWNADIQSNLANIVGKQSNGDKRDNEGKEKNSQSRHFLPKIGPVPIPKYKENGEGLTTKSTTLSSAFMNKLQSLREARIRRNSRLLISKLSKNRNQVQSGSPPAGSDKCNRVDVHSVSQQGSSTHFGGDHFANCLEIE
mmetsp:Transcript_28819/g.43521  ORF Transcript_28819/g.43521 Transcript_28819/m.43521 type:complete len:1126 (+) Transcript_28819:171-3548(+)